MKLSQWSLLVPSILALASPAVAHHRQTAPIVALTTDGDTALPRISSPSNKTIALAVQAPAGGTAIVSISPWKVRKTPSLQTVIEGPGNNADPTVSAPGRSFAFDSASDPLGFGLPGQQVFSAQRTQLTQVSQDPTGTSVNPSIDSSGRFVAFESTGDLAGTGNQGTRQVFLSAPGGSIVQLSKGLGTSRNPVLSAKQGGVAFESSSDPKTGADTGVAQIWFGSIFGGSAAPITNGLGPSMNPALSNDGRIVAFESTADLALTLADTGVKQIFIYDTKSKTYAQLTNDALGCEMPSVFKVQQDWRIAFMCGTTPYFFMLRGNQRYQVQVDGGLPTQRVTTELGIHFLVMSTTGDLLNGGATPGNQVYLVNLFKRPALPVPGQSAWFPTQGIPGL